MGLALCGSLCAGITAPTSPGQQSVQPRLLVNVAAAPAAHLITRPVWRHEIATAGPVGAPVASDADSAYASTASGVCAIELAGGKDRWCQGTQASSIALTGGVLATVEADGVIRGRDARTGAARWRNVIGPATSATEQLIQRIWPTRSGFFAMRALLPNRGTAIAEIQPEGDVLWAWSTDVPVAGTPVLDADYAAVGGVMSDRGVQTHAMLFRLGADGGPAATLGAGSDPVAIQPPAVYSLVRRADEGTSGLELAFDISVHDLQATGANADWRFAPDQEENARLPFATPGCCGSTSMPVSIDDRFIYASIGQRVYRYELAPPADQRPILMSDDGLLLAGPYLGRIYVGRQDGVWSASYNGRFLNQMLVAPVRLPAVESAMAFAGATGYVATTDGRVLGFALDDGQPTLRARLPCARFSGIIVAARRVLFECAAPETFIAAFAR